MTASRMFLKPNWTWCTSVNAHGYLRPLRSLVEEFPGLTGKGRILIGRASALAKINTDYLAVLRVTATKTGVVARPCNATLREGLCRRRWQPKLCRNAPLSLGQSTAEYLEDLKKVKASHTRYRALGPELIPVYRQSACR